MNRSVVLCLLVGMPVGALSGCAGGADEAAEAPKHAAVEVAASTEAVRQQSFDETIDGTGEVVPRLGHVASLAAPAPARVSRVFVSVGSTVRAGDPLVEFERAPFDAAAASAESALQTAELAAARSLRLADAGVLPRKDAEAAAAELASARSAAVTARRSRELSTLRSPIAGAVTRVSAVLGAGADPSQPLVDVADPRSLDVELTVSPTDAVRARVGQSVTLFSGTATTGDAVARGHIGEVAAVVDSVHGGVTLRVALTSTNRPLRIAEVVMGRVAVSRHANALTVPEAALVPTGEAYQVFVVDSAQVAHATAVTIGGRANGVVWITAGLRGGERVVTIGAFGVDDGARIVSAKP